MSKFVDTFSCRILLAVLASIVYAFGTSQESSHDQQSRAQTPRPTFRVQSNLVVVDVTVRDRKGGLVSDLSREDFKIYEDNVPQEIVTFALQKVTGDHAPEAQTAPAAVQQSKPPTLNLTTTPRNQQKKEDFLNKRLIILLFDLSSLTTEDLLKSVATATDFVAKRSTPDDLIAVATYSSTIEVLQDLTNDRETLLAVLRKINPTEAGDAAGEDLGDTDSSGETFVPDDVQFNIFNTDRRLSAIENLAKGYREFSERKSLIYFSSGMTTTGIENDAQIRSTVDSANQSNMSIYTVDSRGLTALPPGGDASRGSPGGRALFSGMAMERQTANLSSSQETLTTLAHDTGGTAFQDSNDLAPVFTKVLSDTETYYILGYYSSNTKEDGKFRKIRIDLARPELKLQHRPGYFASKQFRLMTQAERDRQLEDAFNVDRPFSELPFILEADYFKEMGPNAVVPISLQLAGEAVQFEEKGNNREAQFEFLAQVTDPKGRIAGVARDNVQVRLPVQSAEKIRSGQILYTTGFMLRPGDYKLKFLIRDNRSGKLGSFEQAFSVPVLDTKGLETSSVVLGSRLVDAKPESRSVQHRGSAERFQMASPSRDPLVLGDKRIVPSIGNVFVRRQTLYIYFEVYGAAGDSGAGKPQLDSYVMLLQGKSKVLQSEPYRTEEWIRDRKGVAAVSMAVPLRTFQKGSYTLQIHLRDAVNDTNIYRRMPIVIE